MRDVRLNRRAARRGWCAECLIRLMNFVGVGLDFKGRGGVVGVLRQKQSKSIPLFTGVYA